MSDAKFGLKVVAVGLFYILSLLGVYVYATKYTSKERQYRCKPCKCDEKEAKKPPAKPTSKQKVVLASAKVKQKKKGRSIIEREANTLFLTWLEECKKRSKHVRVNLLACVRWYKLHKYLKVDYADEAMIPRRMIGHLILDRLGRSLCTNGAENSQNKYFITKELAAVYSNSRENIRQLKLLKRRHPSIKIPRMRMCILKNGKLVWDFP